MPSAIKWWRPRRDPGPSTKETAHYQTSDWRARRVRILLRDACCCRRCSRVVSGREAHVDHRQPLQDGGTDDDANLQTLCERCHGAKTREEQRGRRGIPK
ncbi:HNHc domain containing protein [uncultured Caudovirales phage]|uniref:HNHc domain containing protein n=1 Tax=uncultured Caudovirales phage TaxID=2100421 RepID=A0A6J5QZ48_9CAUD|nr:HNHc domain containing protein [uncultured Caudovirales phage]